MKGGDQVNDVSVYSCVHLTSTSVETHLLLRRIFINRKVEG